MSPHTAAQDDRIKKIAKVRETITTLKAAVAEFEKNTLPIEHWNWNAEWNQLYSDLHDITENARSMARNSRKADQ